MENKRLLPSYPLFIKDPYFQVWMNNEDISSTNPSYWNGHELPMIGLISHNGNLYRFLGKELGKPMKVVGIDYNTYKTIFVLENELFKIKLEFIYPLTLSNLDILSNPSCYLNYKIETKEKNYEVIFGLSSKILSNSNELDYKVRGDIIRHDGIESGYFGKYKQEILSMATDSYMAEYGYYYLSAKKVKYVLKTDIEKAINQENVACNIGNEERYLLAFSKKSRDKFVLSNDDIVSIYYFGELLRNYYYKDGKTIIDAINDYYFNHKKILEYCKIFDLIFTRENNFSKNYLKIAYASYSQSISEFKLVKDSKNRLLFLSKENSSGGCISTADVTFPSMPLYLIYNPKLVKGMLYPIFDFASMKVWSYDFAPHDVGVYPYCNGQYYSTLWESEHKEKRAIGYFDSKADGALPFYYLYQNKEDVYSDARQMPVEECSNMIICSYLASKYTNDLGFLNENYSLLEKWANYLYKTGLVPGYQLCTDDFAGHLDKNVNLAIKSTIALKCFGLINIKLIKESKIDYLKEAIKRAKKIETYAKKTLPLAFNDNNTYSLKYNLAVDLLSGKRLFSKKLLDNEVDLYLSKMNDYGMPLDTREDYTKVDWMIWCASLTNNKEKQEKIYSSIVNFLECSKDRVPFSDWYHANTGNVCMFKARSVVGANFMPLLVKNKKGELKNEKE